MELSEFKLFVEKTQRYDLEMILEVDRICKKYNIKYWLAYGTMLGAVRHQGFIPWDDDADLFMLNQDYKKFKTIIKTELDEKFRFEDIFSMPDNVMPWGKIFYKGKIAQDYPRQGLNVHHEISIDIFPLYNFPDPKTVSINSYAKKIYSLFHIIISKSNWKYRSKFKYIVSTLYGLIHLKKKIFYKKKFLSVIQKYDSFNGDYLISPSLSGNVEKSIFPKSWFNTTINVDFEGCRLPIPSDYDAFLKFFYGNYMLMPPEDKRWNVNHDIISYDF